MIWHSSVSWTDTKQFLNLLSPQPSFVEKFMDEINSGVSSKVIWEFEDVCGEIVKKSSCFLSPPAATKQPFTSQVMRIVIMNSNNLIFYYAEELLEF